MAETPLPVPPLDGVPPSPPQVAAGGGPNPSMAQLNPAAQVGGMGQVIALALQALAQAAALVSKVGEVIPSFAPTAGIIVEQMKSGLKSALQQGSATMEPSGPNLPQMAAPLPQGNPGPGVPQAPLPPLQAGL